MTERSDRPLVGLRPITKTLLSAYEGTESGPAAVVLSGALGSGRTTAFNALIDATRDKEIEPCVVRLHTLATDDGIQSLLRTYGALVTSLSRPTGFDSDPLDALDAAIESVSDDAVAHWLSGIAGNVRELRGVRGGNFQIKLPAENPFLGALYTFDVLGPRGRWIIDLRGSHATISPAFWVFLSALVGRARARSWKMLFLLTPGDVVYGEKATDALPGPATFLSEIFPDATVVSTEPLSEESVRELVEDTYRPNDFPAELAGRLHSLSKGHPDTLHELLDVLEEDETITWDDDGYSLSDLDDVDMDILVPVPLEDAGDDEDDDAPDLDPAVMELILHVAAQEGQEFTASLIRTVLGVDDDVVDDALDAMENIVREGRYHQQLGTWTYAFNHRFYREWYRKNTPDGVKTKPEQFARDLATVALQSYAPAAFEYIPRAARLFVTANDPRSARNLLAMAMGSERPELTAFALDVAERFEDSPFPASLLPFIYSSTAERAVNGASVEAAEAALERARAWADANEDAALNGYMLLLACRLAIRKGDLNTAGDLGKQALDHFRASGDKRRQGETLNQLAMLALNKNDPASAETFVKQAEKVATIPPVKGHSLYIRGILDKRRGRIPSANKAFQRAVELSTQAGNLPLVLESMLNAGETGLMSGQGAEVASTLERALEMSRALRSPVRERAAARLLCQAEAARQDGEAAYAMAKHALELTRELGRGPQEEYVDLYHCGLFAVMAGRADEAADYLTAAKPGAEKAGDKGLVPEILFNLGQLKLAGQDFDAARGQLEEALALVRQGKDRGRELRILEHLGVALSAGGDHGAAMKRFQEAMDKAIGPQAKEYRKSLRKRIQQEQALASKESPAPPPA